MQQEYDGGRIARQGLSRRRVSINTAASLINYSFVICVGVWYTPYLLSKLPEQVYGIIPLTTSFLQYMLLLMTSLSASVGRYVTADLSRGDLRAANATFNGFFFGGLKVVAGIAVVIAIFCVVLPIRVPAGYESEARFLAAAIFGSALLLGFGNCFDTAIWATSRIELRHMIEAAAIVIRTGSVVVLFAWTQPSLWQVGAAAALAALFQFSSTYAVWKKLTPELSINRKAITQETQDIIYTTGRWILLVNLGTALLMSSDLIVINRFYDTAQGARYAVVLLWVSILRGIFASLQSGLMPSMVALEARKDHESLFALLSRGIRLTGTLSAHAAAILCGMALPILKVWLRKPWVGDAAPVAWFVLFPLALEASFGALLPAILTTADRVRKQAIASCTIAVLGVAAGIALVQYTSLGMYGVAFASGSASLLRYAIFNPVQATSGFEDTPWHYFLRQAIPTALRFFGTAPVAYLAAKWMQPSSYLGLGVCALAVTAVTLPVSIAFLPAEDRAWFRRFLKL